MTHANGKQNGKARHDGPVRVAIVGVGNCAGGLGAVELRVRVQQQIRLARLGEHRPGNGCIAALGGEDQYAFVRKHIVPRLEEWSLREVPANGYARDRR